MRTFTVSKIIHRALDKTPEVLNNAQMAEESEFDLVSPLILRLRRKELLGTAPEKLGSIFTQCFSTNHDDNDRPSDILALWAQIRIFAQNE